jgi:hypothetical protein
LCDSTVVSPFAMICKGSVTAMPLRLRPKSIAIILAMSFK